MRAGDTIVAVATGHARSARGIVRLSGPGTSNAAGSVLVGRVGERGAHLARLRLPTRFGERTLPARLLFFDGPRSYTGEDCAEIVLPGNPALLDRVVEALLRVPGVRLAEPGEFSARAFLSGRMTPEEAEGVAAAIGARSEAELASARRLMSGELGRVYRGLADDLAHALALVEAGIDFTDQEDVVAIEPRELRERLMLVREGIEGLVGPRARAEREPGAARVVLVGRPNAGKSTLFNALLGRRRAVVAPVAGTTRDAIEEPLVFEGSSSWGPGEAVLVDLAGLDEGLAARSALDDAGQRAARQAIDRADVLVLCDPTGRFVLPGVDAGARPVVRVRTKADLPGDGAASGIAVCALDGWNLEALKRAIADACAAGAGGGGDLPARHRAALRDAGEALDAALGSVDRPEVCAASMRAALDRLGEISGAISPDDVIGRVFAAFCVGK